MDFELKTLTLDDLHSEPCDALIVLIPAEFKSGRGLVAGLVASALASNDLETKTASLLAAYRVAGVTARRLVMVGVGDGSPRSVRSAIAAAVGSLKGSHAQRVTVCLSALAHSMPAAVRSAIAASGEAGYVYDTTKARPDSAKDWLAHVAVGVPSAADIQGDFDRATALLKGVELAKEWANRPSNHATPSNLAGAAKELGRFAGIKVEVLGPKELANLHMGAFAAVAQGSGEAPRFIVMHYRGAPKTVAPLVLIGKGITFDTGGISIKPAAEMDEMKFDMCGAASVLGTFRALAELKPALNVVGLIPACENMPDGRAIKPGDVVTSMSGQTIEILNTDAEGRLVLCDAMTYAERFKPVAVIDIATLTGACVVALGGVRSGLFSTDEALAAALMAAGEASQDLCWRMPLDDEYAEGLKTNFADVANVAGRAGGAVTAAKFLQRFASRYPWAHLDIAGTAWKGGSAKGATGRPVGLLVDYLLAEATRLQVGIDAKQKVSGPVAGKTAGTAVKSARKKAAR
jgi:leucyl aminopeptidase